MRCKRLRDWVRVAELKALGTLAVAERDILTRFARSNSARSDDSNRRDRASPFHSPEDTALQPHASPTDSLVALAHPSHNVVARQSERQRAPPQSGRSLGCLD